MGLRTRRSLWACAAGALLCSPALCAADTNCDQVNDMMQRLNPGFWAPSYVFRSLQVRPGAIHPPNLTRVTRSSQLVGACDTSRFRADSFVWQKPTSDGGDWIASTTLKPMQLIINEVPCSMTGLAVTTMGWPTLRLQFEDCPRKTALEVPLINVTTGGLKLVHWLCKVAYDSQLCAEAAMRLPKALQSTIWPTQEFLDLAPLVDAASQGASRMQVYDNCYESLDWFIINTAVGIPQDEFEMLLALDTVLSPPSRALVELEASLVVETVCFPDCAGRMPEKCKPRGLDLAMAAGLHRAKESSESWEDFVQNVQEPDVHGWSVAIYGACFLGGAIAAVSCLGFHRDPPKSPERRIKKVVVNYPDSLEAHTFDISSFAARGARGFLG